jgi:hypothetical protein
MKAQGCRLVTRDITSMNLLRALLRHELVSDGVGARIRL